MIIYFLTILVYVGQALAFGCIYQSISKNKISSLDIFILTLIIGSTSYLITYFGFVFIFLFFYLKGYYNNKQENKILLWFYGVYTTLVTSLLGYMFLTFTSMLLNVTKTTTFMVLALNIIAPCFPVLVNYLMLTLLKPNIDFLKTDIDFLNKPFLIVINGILSICCVIQYTHYWFENHIDSTAMPNYLIIIFTGIIITLLGYLSFKIRELNNQQIQQLKDEQVVDLANYVEHIETLYNDLRSFRHDYQNVLISLKESIQTQDIAIVEATYQNILANEKINLRENRYHLTKLNNLKVLPVKGIISAKTIKALQENIQVSLEITEPITETSIDILDYVRVLSILLDNAIEAAVQAAEPLISIIFFMDSEHEEQKIIIENSCSAKQLNISQIYELGYSTKGKNRGIGLATLKEIFNQYDHLSLETECSDYLFRQVITIKGGEHNEYIYPGR